MDEYGFIISDPTLFDVLAVDPQTAWAVGLQGVARRTADGGETWERRSDYDTTSAQYYNELYVDPQDADVLYSMDTFSHRSDDGGKTWVNKGLKDSIDILKTMRDPKSLKSKRRTPYEGVPISFSNEEMPQAEA